MKKLFLLAFLLSWLAVGASAQSNVLTVTETDGVPRKTGITTLIFDNTTVTISGNRARVTGGGGGGTVGQPVVGGGNNRVLYTDASGNLKTSANFAYVETSGALVLTPSSVGTGILVQGGASPINGLANLGTNLGLFEMGIASGVAAFTPLAIPGDGIIRNSSATGGNGNTIFINNNSAFVGDFLWSTGALGADTEKMRLTQGGKLSVSPTVNSRDNVRFNYIDATPRFQFGTLNATPLFAAIWMGNMAASDLNYTLTTETGANVLINATTGGTIGLRYAAATNIYAFSSGLATFGAATAGTRMAVPFRTHTALAANTNDYAPSAGNGVNNRISSSVVGPINLTGLVAGSDGEVRFFANVGANAINVTNQDAGSAAANRFTTTTAGTLSFTTGRVLQCVYDSISTTWRVALL